jgi:hypothetical protein
MISFYMNLKYPLHLMETLGIVIDIVKEDKK